MSDSVLPEASSRNGSPGAPSRCTRGAVELGHSCFTTPRLLFPPVALVCNTACGLEPSHVLRTPARRYNVLELTATASHLLTFSPILYGRRVDDDFLFFRVGCSF